MNDLIIYGFCPQRTTCFTDLLRRVYPDIWYRQALLQMMVSYAGILNGEIAA